MLRLLRKLAFWAVVLVVLKHSLTIAGQLVKTFGDSTNAGLSAANLLRIDSALQREHLMEDGYPSDFNAFMARSFHGNPARTRLDSWGRAFRYERRPEGYVIGSSGPDRRFNTGDDLVIERRGRRVMARLYPAAKGPSRGSGQSQPILARMRHRYMNFMATVRREFSRLRAEVKKARREQTLKRARRRGARQ